MPARRRPARYTLGVMRLRHTTAFALAASLACHGTLVLAALWLGEYETVHLGRARPVIVPTLPQPPADEFGDRGGIGQALANLAAAQELRSPNDAQDQPLLGLFQPGPLREQLTPAEMLARVELTASLPTGVPVSTLAEALRAGERPTPPPGIAPLSDEAQTPARNQEGAPVAAATDPGPAADREVDLFTQEAFADFQAGEAVARDGRAVKIRGLRRGLAAFVDLGFLPRPIVVRFRIVVDEEGTPLEVEIQKSSGAEALDHAIRKELFNSWFDPDPSGTGRDLGKPFHFTLRIV